jgi:hypothetical protein
MPGRLLQKLVIWGGIWVLVAACSSRRAINLGSGQLEDASVAALEDAGTLEDAGAIDATAALCPDQHEPSDPIDYGRCEISRALSDSHSTSEVRIATVGDPDAPSADKVDPRPESFVIVAVGATTWIVGRDPNGALYGALELAERLRLDGAAVLPVAEPITGTPAVAVRAANPFLVLPDIGEDRSHWWFLDPSFWRTYLDLLAHARMNLLDLHGMYDLETTIFPNALLYFARSSSYPDVGVASVDRESNLAMLNQVVRLAKARGIRVGLMSYRADSSPDGLAPEQLDENALKTYTREAALDLATRAPDLSRIGFRIGESGRPAQWYRDTFLAGVHAAGTGIGVYTRTWVTSKDEILALLAGEPDSAIVEAKFNGEHWGPPYAIAGGQFTDWSSYSYQGYLNPPTPYTFVFQVRAGGTHRIFRQASYERTRQAIRSLSMSPRVAGFTLEPPTAYFPQHDSHHANPADRPSEWTFARDDMMYLLWGRLGYDPDTPERIFQAELSRRTGTPELWDSLQAASDIVPWIQTGHTCGPDGRDYAPELEMGGDLGVWASRPGQPSPKDACRAAGPFDTFAVAAPAEAADDLVRGRATTRVSPLEIARRVLADSDRASAASSVMIPPGNRAALDVVRECVAVADLGRFFAHKLRAATALAVHTRTADARYLAAARAESAAAAAAWQKLAEHTAYILPFAERLRMKTLGYDPFHWSKETPKLDADVVAIDSVAASVQKTPPVFTGTLPEPTAWLDASSAMRVPAQLTIEPPDPTSSAWVVTVAFSSPLPPGTSVRVLWKPYASETRWSTAEASPTGLASYAATVAGGGQGGLFAAEVETSSRTGWRVPQLTEGTPYVSCLREDGRVSNRFEPAKPRAWHLDRVQPRHQSNLLLLDLSAARVEERRLSASRS